jgi:hypothetical protein
MQHQRKYGQDQKNMNKDAPKMKKKETNGPKQDQYQRQHKKHCIPAFQSN